MTTSTRQLLVLLACSLVLSSCAKINLSGAGKGGGQTATSNPSPAGQQSTGTAQTGSPPPVLGDWELDYEFSGNTFMGNVSFAQEGSALAGQGADQEGKAWTVENGQVQGTKVSFEKKYQNSQSPPIVYSGELKYLEGTDYTGWAMEGVYTSKKSDGQELKGKWVANPLNTPAPEAQAQPAQQQAAQPMGLPFMQQQGQAQKNSAPEHIGDVKPLDISGHYEVAYSFKFKKIKSKMWLENDGDKVTGRGYDITEKVVTDKKGKNPKKTAARDEFTIVKGWYKYPNVTLIRQYKDSRHVEFKAQLSSNGHEIVMKGETEYGGQWDARNVSVIPH